MFWTLRKRLAPSWMTALLVVGLACLNGLTQDLRVEPQSLEFDSVAIGYKGEARTNQWFSITNQSDEQILATFTIQPDESAGLFSLCLPEAVVARSVIRDIYCAVGRYRQDYRQDPSSIEELVELGYIHLGPVSEEWCFTLIGCNPVSQIESVSTDQMPDGADHVIQFDCSIGYFFGFGFTEGFSIGAGESRFLAVSFQPEAEDETEGEVDISWNDGQNHVQIPLHGAGYVPETLVTSAHRLSFGAVSLTDRGRMEIAFSNPSRLFMVYDFDFSDAEDWEHGSFEIYNARVDDAHTAILDILDACIRYRSGQGQDASSVEQLQAEGYVMLSEDVLRKWRFTLIGSNPITQIEAVSGAELLQGSGHVLLYDLQSRRFSGFGSGGGTILGPGREQLFIVEFLPEEVGTREATLTIQANNDFVRCFAESFTTTVRLIGNGVLTAPPVDNASLPQLLSLSPAYPNPFNSATTIHFNLLQPDAVKLTIHDTQGRLIATLVNEILAAGSHAVEWDARDLPAAAYLARMETGAGFTATQRIALTP